MTATHSCARFARGVGAGLAVLGAVLAAAWGASPATGASPTTVPKPTSALRLEAFTVPSGRGAHDVAPARNGGVWYTGQATGELGLLDPQSGEVRRG